MGSLPIRIAKRGLLPVERLRKRKTSPERPGSSCCLWANICGVKLLFVVVCGVKLSFVGQHFEKTSRNPYHLTTEQRKTATFPTNWVCLHCVRSAAPNTCAKSSCDLPASIRPLPLDLSVAPCWSLILKEFTSVLKKRYKKRKPQ